MRMPMLPYGSSSVTLVREAPGAHKDVYMDVFIYPLLGYARLRPNGMKGGVS